MLWVYGHYKYVYRRQILPTKVDPRAIRVNLIKDKGAGLYSDIKPEDLSAYFTFYPMVTGPVRSCANSAESIQSCSHFGALNLSYVSITIILLKLYFILVCVCVYLFSAYSRFLQGCIHAEI